MCVRVHTCVCMHSGGSGGSRRYGESNGRASDFLMYFVTYLLRLHVKVYLKVCHSVKDQIPLP